MTDFKILKDTCMQNSDLCSQIIENFLFRNVVNHKKSAEETGTRFAPYRHVVNEFKSDWVNLLMTQYLVHSILKKDGLIKKYLNHSAIKKLKQSELDYLHHLIEYPWKFSFSLLTGSPNQDFFEMKDAFTGESFLLYSPGISNILRESNIRLWFNLIGYNGRCWQSYGPIGAYNAFTTDDIFFFASELNPNQWIDTGEDLMADVERNPVPYMMLLSGSNYPITVHNKDTIVQAVGEYDIETFTTKGLHKDFNIEYVDNVYRLSLKRWSGHPHFASAYYDENRKVLHLYSMTDRGFYKLAERLNSYGFDLYPNPDIRVTLPMLTAAGLILNREIRLNEYDDLFIKEQPETDNEYINNLNNLLEMALPDLNAGKKPDIKSLAMKAGIDEETAKLLLKQVSDKIFKTK